VQNGHDGTWVAHPALVDLARAEFDLQMEGPHQIGKAQSNKTISRADLLCAPQGEITLAGLRHNLSVGIRYMAAWLCGNGCVPIDNLMEDAATAEISRTQLWQWRHHGAETTDGILVDADLLRDELTRTLDELRTRLGDIAFTRNRMALAGELFAGQIMARDLPAFLTLEAYEHLTN
jgi:malate synthase